MRGKRDGEKEKPRPAGKQGEAEMAWEPFFNWKEGPKFKWVYYDAETKLD